jgi:hypothetical protein
MAEVEWVPGPRPLAAVCTDDDVLLIVNGSSTLFAYDADGGLLGQCAMSSEASTADGSAEACWASIALAGEHRDLLLVADTSSRVICVFYCIDWTLVSPPQLVGVIRLVEYGTTDDWLLAPRGLGYDHLSRSVVVCDATRDSCAVFSMPEELLLAEEGATAKRVTVPVHLLLTGVMRPPSAFIRPAFDQDRSDLLVATVVDAGGHRIAVYVFPESSVQTPDTCLKLKPTYTVGAPGNADGELLHPLFAMAWAPEGDPHSRDRMGLHQMVVLACDSGNGRIQAWPCRGGPVLWVIERVSEDEGDTLRRPCCVCFSSLSEALIVDEKRGVWIMLPADASISGASLPVSTSTSGPFPGVAHEVIKEEEEEESSSSDDGPSKPASLGEAPRGDAWAAGDDDDDDDDDDDSLLLGTATRTEKPASAHPSRPASDTNDDDDDDSLLEGVEVPEAPILPRLEGSARLSGRKSGPPSFHEGGGDHIDGRKSPEGIELSDSDSGVTSLMESTDDEEVTKTAGRKSPRGAPSRYAQMVSPDRSHPVWRQGPERAVGDYVPPEKWRSRVRANDTEARPEQIEARKRVQEVRRAVQQRRAAPLPKPVEVKQRSPALDAAMLADTTDLKNEARSLVGQLRTTLEQRAEELALLQAIAERDRKTQQMLEPTAPALAAAGVVIGGRDPSGSDLPLVPQWVRAKEIPSGIPDYSRCRDALGLRSRLAELETAKAMVDADCRAWLAARQDPCARFEKASEVVRVLRQRVGPLLAAEPVALSLGDAKKKAKELTARVDDAREQLERAQEASRASEAAWQGERRRLEEELTRLRDDVERRAKVQTTAEQSIAHAERRLRMLQDEAKDLESFS